MAKKTGRKHGRHGRVRRSRRGTAPPAPKAPSAPPVVETVAGALAVATPIADTSETGMSSIGHLVVAAKERNASQISWAGKALIGGVKNNVAQVAGLAGIAIGTKWFATRTRTGRGLARTLKFGPIRLI